MEEKVTKVAQKTEDSKKVEYTVEEISNGFVLTKCESWMDPKSGYNMKSTKTYSKTNPLDTSVLSQMSKMKQAIGQTDEDGDEVVS